MPSQASHSMDSLVGGFHNKALFAHWLSLASRSSSCSLPWGSGATAGADLAPASLMPPTVSLAAASSLSAFLTACASRVPVGWRLMVERGCTKGLSGIRGSVGEAAAKTLDGIGGASTSAAPAYYDAYYVHRCILYVP